METYNDNNELYHYGVPGMKWKNHKYVTYSKTYNNMRQAKAAKKEAYKQYNKDFNSAYGYSSRHSIGQLVSKKKKAESNKRWGKVNDSANAYEKAKMEYKQAKSERRTAIRNKTKEINKKASLGDKLMYNSATRSKAAKYVVDNNMSVSEATKKAKGEAWRNTAAFVAAYSAIAIGTAAYAKNKR